MLQQFKQFIQEEALFSVGESVLLGVSGGKDSMAMLHLFKEAGYTFGIAHCNFQLRGEESEGDEAYVKEVAEKMGVPFFSARFDTQTFAEEKKVSIQMAARELRYTWFRKLAERKEYQWIAIAHHKSDVVETILINSIRGTGISGLIGPRPKIKHIIRPLLCFSDEEIEGYIRERNISFREDSSNASTKYLRNKVRLELLPMLRDMNPSIEDTILANIDRFSELEEMQQSYLKSAKRRLVQQRGKRKFIHLEELKRTAALRTVLHHLLLDYHFSATDLDNLIDCLDGQSGKQFLSSSHQLVVDREYLILTPLGETMPEEQRFSTEEELLSFGDYSFRIQVVEHGNAQIISSSQHAFLDADVVGAELSIRVWEPGDKCYPLGMEMQKKVSDLLVDQKVPLTEKQQLPVLLSQGRIVWVVGQRIDNRFRVTANTQKVLHIYIENYG